MGSLHSEDSIGVSRQDFTTTNQSVGAVSPLSDFSRQIGQRNELMVSRLSD